MITNRNIALSILETFSDNFESVKKEHKKLIEVESALEEIIETLPRQIYVELSNAIADLTNIIQDTAYLVGLEDGARLYDEITNGNMVKEIIKKVWTAADEI